MATTTPETQAHIDSMMSNASPIFHKYAQQYQKDLTDADDRDVRLATLLWEASAFSIDQRPSPYIPPIHIRQALAILKDAEQRQAMLILLTTPRMYRHVKRGSIYHILGTATYQGKHAALEGMSLSTSIEPNTGSLIATAAGPQDSRWLVTLQAQGAVRPGDLLTIYEAEEDNTGWGRPVDEFFDGRFEQVKS